MGVAKTGVAVKVKVGDGKVADGLGFLVRVAGGDLGVLVGGFGFGVSVGSGLGVFDGSGFGVSLGLGRGVLVGGMGVSLGSGSGVAVGFGVLLGSGSGVLLGRGSFVLVGRGVSFSSPSKLQWLRPQDPDALTTDLTWSKLPDAKYPSQPWLLELPPLTQYSPEPKFLSGGDR